MAEVNRVPAKADNAVWTPSEGETVQVVDRDSNDFGKVGTISQKRHTPNVEKPYGVTFGDNVMRYFSRDGLTWVSSPTAQPSSLPAETPAEPSRLWVKLEYSTGGGTHATLTISGSNAEVSALAAWVAACNG